MTLSARAEIKVQNTTAHTGTFFLKRVYRKYKTAKTTGGTARNIIVHQLSKNTIPATTNIGAVMMRFCRAKVSPANNPSPRAKPVFPVEKNNIINKNSTVYLNAT